MFRMAGFATRWFGLRRDLGEHYSPLYFLAALGNGGMAVAFFIWLNFLLPHPQTPIITFDGIAAFLPTAPALARGLVFGALAGIIFFAARHLRLVAWNLREYLRFKQTAAYTALRETNGAVALMALPLTLAMSVNVFFVLGAVFVPGLWNVVEYLFPFSLTALLAIGVLALRTFLDLFGRALASGHFDCTRNNHLSQLQAVMTFAMVAVGLAAPAAMSANPITIAVSIFASIFFLGAAALLGVVLLVLGFRGMLAHGLAVEAGPSMWLLIPILTLAGIALIRISHGLHHGFGMHTEPGAYFLLTGTILALQLLVGLIGYSVLRRVGYFRTYVWGAARSPGSYGLICPAVALVVFGMFFVHPGLVQTGLIAKYSLAHYLALAPLAGVQLLGIATMLRLDAKLIRPQQIVAPAGETAAAQGD
jgi:hypothetical protein